VSTYYALMSLCILKSEKALKIIKIQPLVEWIKILKHENGAFSLNEHGDEDLRYNDLKGYDVLAKRGLSICQLIN
jgi:prenyltransferase beta subunit